VADQAPENSTYQLRVSLRDIRKTFIHFGSLFVVLTIATILGLFGLWLNAQTNVSEIAMSIFQVSGTMVALALPASELANNFITKFSDELLVKILRETAPDKDKADLILGLSEELRNNLAPAWRASVYALSSFFLSCVVMFVPTLGTPTRSLSFLGHFLLGLSLGFVMVGAFWFFPTVRYIFRLELLKNVDRVARELEGSKKKPGT
jgi:hypothetical protein